MDVSYSYNSNNIPISGPHYLTVGTGFGFNASKLNVNVGALEKMMNNSPKLKGKYTVFEILPARLPFVLSLLIKEQTGLSNISTFLTAEGGYVVFMRNYPWLCKEKDLEMDPRKVAELMYKVVSLIDPSFDIMEIMYREVKHFASGTSLIHIE